MPETAREHPPARATCQQNKFFPQPWTGQLKQITAQSEISLAAAVCAEASPTGAATHRRELPAELILPERQTHRAANGAGSSKGVAGSTPSLLKSHHVLFPSCCCHQPMATGRHRRSAQVLLSQEQAADPALQSVHSKGVKADAGCRRGPGAGAGREAQNGNALLGDGGAWCACPAQLHSSLVSVVFSTCEMELPACDM